MNMVMFNTTELLSQMHSLVYVIVNIDILRVSSRLKFHCNGCTQDVGYRLFFYNMCCLNVGDC